MPNPLTLDELRALREKVADFHRRTALVKEIPHAVIMREDPYGDALLVILDELIARREAERG